MLYCDASFTVVISARYVPQYHGSWGCFFLLFKALINTPCHHDKSITHLHLHCTNISNLKKVMVASEERG